jgi:hypothetical protein
MARGHGDRQLVLGQGGELERRRLRVRRPERRRAGDDRQVQRPRPQGAGQRGRRRLAQRDLELGRQRGQRARHEPRRGHGERAEPHRPRRRVRAGQLTRRGVELVQHARRPGEQARAGRGEHHALPAALEQAPAGHGLERRRLARDGRLCVAKGARGSRERAGLGNLAQHAQPGGREVVGHACSAWYACGILVLGMVGGRLPWRP